MRTSIWFRSIRFRPAISTARWRKGRRLVSAVSYWRKDIKDNGYAHPIEGVVALVDLIENKIVHLVDEPDIIPIPKKSRNYDRASIPQTRNDVKPLDVVQKDGPSFTVEGWKVDWQNWSFRVGWTAREGLVLHQISFRDREREAADHLSGQCHRHDRSPTPTRPPTISGNARSMPGNMDSASSPTRSNSAATASATSTISTCRSPMITASRPS